MKRMSFISGVTVLTLSLGLIAGCSDEIASERTVEVDDGQIQEEETTVTEENGQIHVEQRTTERERENGTVREETQVERETYEAPE